MFWGAILLTAVALAQPVPEEEVWQAVRAAGLPQELVRLAPGVALPEAVAIGRPTPDGKAYLLNAVYLDHQYLSANQATGKVLGRLTPEKAVGWVEEILLAFEHPCRQCPEEFVTRSDFVEPAGEADGHGGFKVKLWVQEGEGQFSLRQYHLTATGFRLSVPQRLKL